jgi:hypothetical protein
MIKSTITRATPLRLEGFVEIAVVGSAFGSPVGVHSKLFCLLYSPIAVFPWFFGSPSSLSMTGVITTDVIYGAMTTSLCS